MNLWQQYVCPASVSEAVQTLAAAPGAALPIAGGTDLMLDLSQGRHPPVHTIVDLTGIPEMTALEMRGDELFIGAARPLTRIARDPLAVRHAQALVEACDLIAGPQVRNVATLGGNAAHALPAADGTVALTALGAEVEIANPAGTRRIPFTALFLGPGKSVLKHGEDLIVGFFLPMTHDRQASAFKRIMRPQGVALPILNCACYLERDGDTIGEVRIAVGPGGPTPFRATEAESALRGKPFDAATLSDALDALLQQAKFRTSAQRATAEYRYHLVGGLLKDTLETAWERARS